MGEIMVENNAHSDIRSLLDSRQTTQAQQLAADRLRAKPDATLYYLHGLACARLGEYHHAINSFVRAERLDPHSPAVHAKAMLNEIYAFRNTDMINP